VELQENKNEKDAINVIKNFPMLHKNPAVCPGKQTAQQVLNSIIYDDSESLKVGSI